MWAGLVEDLGSTIGPQGMTNITPSNINIPMAHETKEGNVVMSQHNPRGQNGHLTIKSQLFS